METLEAPNTSLETITLTSGTALKTLDLSGNKLTAIDVNNCVALETLYLSKNKIATFGFGSMPTTLKTLDISDNNYTANNQYTLDLKRLTALTSLTIGGNQLKAVDVSDPKCTINYGIQDFTWQSEYQLNNKYVKSNENLDIVAMATSYGLGAQINSATEWKKLKTGTEDTFEPTYDAHSVANATNYRFYDKTSKAYVDGTYECVLVSDNGFKYRVRVKIDKAKFTLKMASLDHGTWAAATATGTELYDGLQVTQGNNLVLRVDFTNAPNYDLKQFKTEGLVLTNGSVWTKNGATCQIAGTYVDATTDGTISIDAEVVAKEYTVSFDNNFTEGHVEMFAQDAKGDFTIPLQSEDKVVYDTQVKIVLIPNTSGIAPTIAVNGVDKSNELTKDNAGKWFFTTTIKENTKFTPNFGVAKKVHISATVNGVAIGNTTEPQVLQLIKGNTIIKLPKDAGGTDIVEKEESYQLNFALNAGVTLDKVTIGSSTLVEMEKTAGPNNSTVYMGTVKIPSTDAAVINISTKNVAQITVNPSKIIAGNNTQQSVFDGNEHPFEFTTTPAGLEKGFVVTYSLSGKNTFTSALPKNAGKYEVKLEYTAEGRDLSYNCAVVTDYYVELLQATPVFATLPTVTYNKDTKTYEVSGSQLKGKFEVKAVAGADVTKSHLVDVTFKPEDKNYKEITFKQEVIIDGKALDRTSIKVVNNTNAAVEVWNGGEKMTNNSGQYLKDSQLTVYVTYPEGIDPKDVNVESALNKTVTAVTVNTSERVKTFTYAVTSDNDELHVKVNAALDNKYVVVLNKVAKLSYTKEGQAYPTDDIKVYNSKDLNTPLSNVTPVVSYEGINGLPVNVGKYNVRVQIKAGNGFVAYDETFKDKFEIVKAKTTISKQPTATPISLGQVLRFSNLEGGLAAGVQGAFEWENGSVVPEDAKEYKAIFKPTDAANYETAECKVAVTVIDQRLVTYYTNFPGQTDITVKDKSGKYYESGDPVAKGTVLSITTATINNDLELASLSVAGATKNSDGTYTVGDASIEISATFQVKTKPGNFKVTVPEYLRGAIITGGGEHVVAEGGTLSFTVATASADASKVSVKASNGTVTKGSNGRYTLSGLTANSTVTVSLSNPTALKVDIQKSYLNAGKYHVATVEVESDYTDGKFYYGDEITVVAYPESGVKFEKWSDGSKDQVHDIVLTGDLKLTATFSGTPTGIEDIMAASIATGKGCVWVRGIANADVTIVSIAGRVQARQRISGDTRIDVPAGIYVVVLESGSDVKRVKVIVK